ncbi:hypothetical protein EJ05DRAFT_534111 [Pseudovirgaria hyperparasitica]|uniref:Uncharacterized protein n=1 Tax=Pseudovirgaria hyperparasitica TaxID=470096 RepID=A0A6A6WK80_9PEZI|nr:uncharacterized protein EJ05DRAFT_534111 [Pseudovirgaria hyperparasitica]KAF2762580.1 hypothetical protein EJ05DRAFT_534111 [Pseudovirgaria hyperparasitica]
MPKGISGRAPPKRHPATKRRIDRSKTAPSPGEETGSAEIDDSVTAADVLHGRVNINIPEASSSSLPASDEAASPDNGDQPMHDAPTPPVQSIESPQAHSPQVAPENSGWTVVNAPNVQEATTSSNPAASPSTPASVRPAPLSRVSALKAYSAASPARSVSPGMSSVRGGKKVLKHQPFFQGRRSKEERDARTSELQAKERLKKAAQEAEDNAAAAAALRRAGWGARGGSDRGRGRGRGRGSSYMGDRGSSQPIGVAGPFSAGVAQETRKFVQRARVDDRSKIKQEDPSNPALASNQQSVDGGYISSDPDDEQQGPRFNVAAFENLLSDDDDDSPHTTSISRPKKTPASNYIPVRLARLEHKDRVMGINTEASAAPTGVRNGNTSVKGEPGASNTSPVQRKAKLKTADVEVVSSSQFKGVWNDSSDEAPPIKPDPEAAPPSPTLPTSPTAKVKSPSTSPTRNRKPARRRSSHLGRDAPNLQTEEDRQEWARHNAGLAAIRNELGNIVLDPTKTYDEKKDRVYLFQLPPIMPSLHPLSKDKGKEKGVKFDESTKPGVDEDGSNVEAEPETHLHPTFAAGCAGKLRIHESGRACLSWGGTSFALDMGIEAGFLEDIVVIRTDKEVAKTEDEDVEMGDGELATKMATQAKERAERDERAKGGFGGDATSFGQVRGKFVLSPDWGEIKFVGREVLTERHDCHRPRQHVKVHDSMAYVGRWCEVLTLREERRLLKKLIRSRVVDEAADEKEVDEGI